MCVDQKNNVSILYKYFAKVSCINVVITIVNTDCNVHPQAISIRPKGLNRFILIRYVLVPFSM